MRDPARIPRLLEKLQFYWERSPDFRLGQLVTNLAATKDPFYTEDDVIEGCLDEWIRRLPAPGDPR